MSSESIITKRRSLDRKIIEQAQHDTSKFLPSVPDRLIGRHMGERHFDILLKIKSMGLPFLGEILSYLDPLDLSNMCLVNKSFLEIVLQDKISDCKRRCYLDKMRSDPIARKSLQSKRTPMTGNHVPLGTIQRTSTRPFSNPIATSTPSNESIRFSLNQEVRIYLLFAFSACRQDLSKKHTILFIVIINKLI